MNPTYPFRNLVFEGGGTLGIAYVGVMEELEKRHILTDIHRVGGASAGAINAVLFALGYSSQEVWDELSKLDFNTLQDYQFFLKLDCFVRVFTRFGFYRGNTFKSWIKELIARKTGNAEITFKQLKAHGSRDLYLIGTNLNTSYYQIYSPEHTPDIQLADAVRISMSIPLMFAAVKDKNNDIFVDGGVLDNYPVRLFDQQKYIDLEHFPEHTTPVSFYAKSGQVKMETPDSYLFNLETLGFRLHGCQINGLGVDPASLPHWPIHYFGDYFASLIKAFLNVQSNSHLETEDWQRTIYIDTQDINGFNFNIDMPTKLILAEAGRQGVINYFKWYDKKKPKKSPARKPALETSK